MGDTGPTTMPELIVERCSNDIVLLTLNRPRAKNSVSFAMWEAFSAALEDIEHTTPARLVILRGADGIFSAGGDFKVGPARGEGALALAARLELGQRVISRLRALPIPTIAAVEGAAIGIGWSLAMACDMIFAADNARFAAPFLDFGLIPDGGAAWFLTKQLGRARAADIIFSSRTIEAAEALAMGLVSRVVAPGTAVEEALALGASIGGGNRHAVELTKRLIQHAEMSDLTSTHALELAYCHICQAGEEVPRARELAQKRHAASTNK